MLTPVIETEIAALAARYGQPRRVSATLTGAPFDPLIMNDRIGEVCMVLRRPNGKLLAAIKTFYPPNAYRLLTGGVKHGEPIETALLREVEEETGLMVIVRRFLAMIEYELEPENQEPRTGQPKQKPKTKEQADTQHRYSFVTFAFLLDEVSGTLGPRDPDERIASFREIEVAELPALAATLDHIDAGFDPQIGGVWGDWGRFRAVVHRVVSEVLRAPAS
jgi:NAD+ diphosphatase